MIKRARCKKCGQWWEFDSAIDPVIMKPYPHWDCEDCFAWIPAF